MLPQDVADDLRCMTRSLLTIAAVILVLVALTAAGYEVVHARAHGGGTAQPVATPVISPSPTTAGATPAPVPHWLVAKAVHPLVAYTRPAASSRVKARLGMFTANHYPTILLVKTTRQVGQTVWYDVWLPVRPNGSRGWIREGSVTIFTTTAMIRIDLSARRLTVYRRGTKIGSFPVAVGTPQLPTPTGYFYVNQKLRPATPGGPFGVLALGLSAFQPRLPNWPGGGPVAIHGTNEDTLIGQAVSHGCVRMHNADVLKVSGWVPTGSPVVIVK
jgi:lipoprotein-anchoring transpeptidase ErfK/SrfK